MNRRLTDSPTLVTLGLLVGTFGVQQLVGLVTPHQHELFGLSNPLLEQPWTLVTSVYAHAGVGHLLANAVALAFVGFIIERRTTSARYHLFFLLTGILAGVAQVGTAGLLGPFVPGMTARVTVLGASGAIFGLGGYLLASNRVTETVIGGVKLSARAQLAIAGGLAAVITIATANPGVALIAHFTGLLIGFLAGRDHLLRPGRKRESPPRSEYGNL